MSSQLNLVSGVRKESSRKGRNPASRLLAAFLILVGVVAVSASPADASIVTWTGGSSGVWNTSTNWNATSGPIPAAGDTAQFNSTSGTTTIDLTGVATDNSVLFDLASAAAYTIGSGVVNSQTFALSNAGAVTMNSTVAANQTFNANVLLGTATASSYTFTNDSTTNTLTFAGNVQGGTGGTGAAKTLTVTGSGNTTLSGLVANGGASALALTKSGTGTVVLGGRNTYTGATTVNAGALNVQTSTALGATSGVTVVSGAALQIQGTYTIDRTLTLNGMGVSNDGALRNISGVGKYSGNITLGSAARINSDADILRTFGTINNAGFGLTVGGASDTSIWGILSGAGTLVMDGTGNLRLGAANTYTGVTYINSGTVFLNAGENVNASGPLGKQLANAAGSIVFGGGTLQFSAGNVNDYSGRFSIAANQAIKIDTSSSSILFATPLTSSGGSLTVSGLGTLTLTALNTYSGKTTVKDTATLALNLNTAAGDNVVSSSSALVLGGNLNVIGAGGITARLQTFNGTTFNAGNAAITPTLNAASATGNVLTVNLGALARNAGGTGTIVLGTGNTSTTNTQINTTGTASSLITDSNGVAFLTFGTTATSIRDWAVMDSGNTKIVQAPASGFYTAATATTIPGNADIGALSPSITGSIGDNAVASIRFDNAGASTLTLNNNGGGGSTFSVGGILVSSNVGNNPTLITGSGTLQGPNAGTGDLVIHNWDTSSNATISIPIGGTGGFTKAGTGLVILSVANSYTGPTTIGGGILQVGNSGITGDLGGTTGTITNNGTLTFNRSSASSALIITNAITGSGALNQNGTGTTILTGISSYRGLTTVNAGTLTFDTGSVRKWTSRGNVSTRSIDGNGVQVNNGTLNVAGLMDVENVYITGGVVNVLPGGELLNRNSIGNGFFGLCVGGNEAVGATYGMLNMTGGTVSNINDIISGQSPRFGVGIRGTAAGLIRVSNGSLNAITLLADKAEITMLGGNIRTAGGNAPFLNTEEGNNNTGAGTCVVNVAGGLFDNGTLGINFGGGTAGSSKTIVNLNAGTLWTQAATQLNGNQASMNFNGGTLKAGAASTTFTPTPAATSSFMTYVNGAFGSYTGGVVIDSNNFNITIPNALLAPTGSGVTAIALPGGGGGAGYAGAPTVTISDTGTGLTGTTSNVTNTTTIAMASTIGVFVGQSISGTGIPLGAIVTSVTPNTQITISQAATVAGSSTLTFKGQGATAYATYSGGAVTGYVVTNPGVGYVGTLSATLSGGTVIGGTAATNPVNADFTTAANSSGGLTKNGLGTLTLSGSTTFTGNTVVNVGTLAFGQTIVNTYASAISGLGAVSQTGAGTTVFSVNNTYTGVTTLTSGVLELTSANALPGGIGSTGGTSDLIFSGGVLGLGTGNFTRNLGAVGTGANANFTGAGGWAAYGADRTVNIGGASAQITWATANTGFNGQTLILSNTSATNLIDLQNPIDLGTAARTIQVDNGTAIVDGKLSGIITGAAGGTLTKTGAGTLELSNDETYSAATTVSAGKLILSGDNSGSASSLTVSANAIAQFNALLSIPSTLRTVTDTGTVMFGTAFTAGNIPAGLLRITTASAGAIAADNYLDTNFDLNTAGLTAASLGVVGNSTYIGTYTPNVTAGYKLGGAGGTMTLSNANALTGALALSVSGNVILTAANNLTGVTTIYASSTLQLGNGVTGQNGSVASSSIVDTGTLLFDNFDNQTYAGIISGAGAVTKIGAGQLILTAQETYSGQTTVSGGTLTLAGGDHTLAVNKAMVVNTGGTLDIGANKQYVGQFSGTGGSVIGSGILTTNLTGAGTYAGSIGSSVNLVKVGAQTLTLSSDNTTNGTVKVIGGGLTLKDSGMLSANSGITVTGNATLTIDNTGAANINGRVNSTSLSLDSGVIAYNGANSTASTETFGAVTANAGVSLITATPGTGTASAVLTLTSLTRSTGAVLNVNQGNSSNLGTNTIPYGNVKVTTFLGSNLTAVNGVIPGVFSAQQDNWNLVGYDSAKGFGVLGTAGFPANYTGTFAAALPTSNLNSVTGAVTANMSVNSINQGTITFTNGTPAGGPDLLTINSGMVIMGTQTFGTTTQRGMVTSGTQELFIGHRDGNATPSPIINSVIVDNGNPVSLAVYSKKGDRGPYLELTAANQYSGGTFVTGGNAQGGILLNATVAGVTIPAGGLTINNLGIVDECAFQGQINSTNVVTINGGGMLRLMGTNTLAGITFNSDGGSTTPSVIPYNTITRDSNTNNYCGFGSKTGTLIITGNISSTPTNVAVTPLFDSGTLDLNASTAHDITIAALPQGNFVNTNTPLNGLTISSIIQNGGFTKTGGGVLNLTGNNTFSTGNLTVAQGVLNVATFNEASTAGPLGQTTLSTILGKSDGSTGTIEYTGGNFTSTRLFTMASGGTGAFQVDVVGTTLTLSGLIDGSGGLSKTGLGMLTLTSPNTYLGDTLVSQGTLSITNTFLADASSVRIYSALGGILNLNTSSGTDTIASLYIDGVQQATGLWGRIGSGATHETSYITGSGELLVIPTSVTGVWSANSGAGHWADSINWSGGAPTKKGDTATFGTGSLAVIDLAGATPIVSALTFNNGSVNYEIKGATGSLTLQGTSTTLPVSVTVTTGSDTISAHLVLASNLEVSGSGKLTLSGSITETGSRTLTMSGTNGTLILSGTGLYSGGTFVNAGILAVTSSSALPDNGSLTVGAGGTLIFDPSFSGSPIVASAASSAAMSSPVSPVPEPSTLVLLMAGLMVGFGAWWKGRKKVEIAN